MPLLWRGDNSGDCPQWWFQFGEVRIARCLQSVLPDPWLAFGVDTLIQAMPASITASDARVEFAPDGEVIVGPEFRSLEAAWIDGVAAMARAGAGVIVDEVFLGGAVSQQRWQKALGGLGVLWVGVRCKARLPQTGRLHGAIGSPEWLHPRRKLFTGAWCMTWK